MKIFDTLDYARRLEDAGVPRAQAETHAALFAEMILGEIATKSDLDQGLALMRRDLDAGLATMRRDVDAGLAAVRKDLGADIAALRKDMETGQAAVRKDLGADIDAVRKDVVFGLASVRVEIAGLRNELTIRLGGLFVVVVGVMTAIQKLL